MTEHVLEVRDETFEGEVLRREEPVIVDFGAPWCPPCRALEPTFAKLAAEYEGRVRFAKVNIDDNPSVTQRYGVKGIPTLILFVGGREVERVVGAAGREAIARVIDRNAVAAEPARA